MSRLNGVKITKAVFNASKAPAHNVHYSIINNRLYSKVTTSSPAIYFQLKFCC